MKLELSKRTPCVSIIKKVNKLSISSKNQRKKKNGDVIMILLMGLGEVVGDGTVQITIVLRHTRNYLSHKAIFRNFTVTYKFFQKYN